MDLTNDRRRGRAQRPAEAAIEAKPRGEGSRGGAGGVGAFAAEGLKLLPVAHGSMPVSDRGEPGAGGKARVLDDARGHVCEPMN